MGTPLRKLEMLDVKRANFFNVKFFATFFTSLLLTSMLFVLPVQNLNAQNYLDKAGLASGPLPSAAFSLRQLSTLYTSSAIQVRRSSDNATQDIGFTALGDLDQAALLAFVGAGDGFVSIWYDQSGNTRNAIQATAANQPRIVNAGAVELVNGKPTVRWTSSGASTQQRLEYSATTSVRTVNAVRDLVNDISFPLVGYNQTLFSLPANADFSVRGGYMTANNTNDWVNGTGTPPTNWVNGVQTLTGTFSLHTITAIAASQKNGTFSISSTQSNNRGLIDNNHVSELILFPVALLPSEREALECNQTLYYGLVISIPDQVGASCSGTAYNLPAVTPPGTTYSWGSPVISPAASLTGDVTGSNSTTFSQSLINATASIATATFTVTPTFCGSVTGTPFSVVVNVAPAIPAIPGVISGSAAPCKNITGLVYSITPVDNATSYTWAFPSNWTGATGGTTNILTINTAANASNGNITITATNSCGTSAPASFAVAPLAIPASPILTAAPTICNGTSTNISTTTSVIGVDYQLRLNTGNVNVGSPVSGTGASLAFPTGNLNTNTGFNVLATNISTGCSVSATQTVTVNPVDRTVSPSATSLCYNTGTNITIATSTTGVTYQLRNDFDNSFIGAPVAGTNGTINLPTGNLISTTTFNVFATHTATGCTGQMTNKPVITVLPLPTATISGDDTACFNTGNKLITFTNPQSLQIRVYYNMNGGANTYIDVPANTTKTITRASNTLGTFIFNLVSAAYTSNPTCSNLISGTATVVVVPVSTISLPLVAGSNIQQVCQNSPVVSITYNITGSGLPPTVTGLPLGVSDAFNAGVLTISGTPSVPGVYSFTITTASPCVPATTNSTGKITVTATPTGTLTATEASGTAIDDLVICAGGTVTFTATAGFGAYEFYVNGTDNAHLVRSASTDNTYSINTLNNNDKVYVKAFDLGCPAFFNDLTITVTPLPVATLSANKTAICPGEAITFTAADAGVGSKYTFKINGVNIIYTGSSNSVTTDALPSSSFYISVEVENTNGCSLISSQKNITVNPVSTGTLTATATSFCVSTNITFTATAGFSDYDFKVDGFSIGAPGASNTFTTSTLTNGQVVSVVAKNGTGCLTTFNALPVTVNPYPAASLSVTENSGTANDGTICAGGVSVTLTATSGFANYDFKIGGVSQQNGSSNTFTRTTFANGNVVTVDVKNVSGCTTLAADSKTITVVPLPIGTLITSSNNICIGSDAVFTASAGFSNYKFIVNTTTVQNGSNNIYTNPGTLTNGQTVTVVVTGTNGCESTFSAGAMTVNPLPTGSLVATETSGNASNDNIICAGATVTFTATGFTNYRFLLNNAEVQNGVSGVYLNSSLNGGDAVAVEVTNGNGCKAIFNAPTITVNPLPVVAATSGALTVCEGSNTTLINTTSGGVWSSNNSLIATVNPTSGFVTGVAAGTVKIYYTVTNGNNCSQKSEFTITVNSLPTVAPIAGLTKVCVGSQITLSNATGSGAWSSSNALIATVGATGKVLGVSAGTVTIYYTVVNASNCTVVRSYIVTVNALPIVAPITGASTLCANGTILLSNSTAGGTGVWTSNNKPVAEVNPSTGLVSGVIAISPEIANIIYTFTDMNGCVSAVNKDVTVNPIPVPSLTGKNPICVGDEEIYTTQSAIGISNYVWNVVGGDITDGGTSTNSTVQVKWTASGTKTINVNYTNEFGCTASTSSSFSNAPTAAPPTFINKVPVACLNSTGNVYSTETGKTDYTWTVNGGTITSGAGTSSIEVTWNVAGAKTVSVNYSDIGGCNAANATVYNVTVNPLPTATISVDKTAACANATAPVVKFTGAGGLAPYIFTYTITTNGVLGTPKTTTANLDVNMLSANTTYIYTLVSVKDSRAISCEQAQGGSVTVTINALPSVVTNPIAVCNPLTANLTNASVTTGSDAGLTYTYFTNSGATNVYATPTAATAGTYWIKGSTVAGCSTVQSVLVTVNPLPTATITGTAAVCINGTSPNITFTGANGTAPYTFTYNVNGGANTTITTTVGNSISTAVPTNIAGGFDYNLVSVQDASSTACSKIQSGIATITVNPVSVGGAVDGTTTVCFGSNGATINLTGNTGSVVRWEYSTNSGTNWITLANTGSSYTYSNITQTTWYRAIVQSGTCSESPSTPSIITVNQVTIPGTVSGSATVCAGNNAGTLNLTGNNGLVIRWESSINAGVKWDTIANITTSQSYSNILQTTLFRAVVQNTPCVEAFSTVVTISVNARPTGVISGSTAICAGEQTTLTISVTGVGTISGTLSNGTAFSGTAPTITLQVTPASNTTYTIATLLDANCIALGTDKTGSAAITVNPLPAAPQLRPVTATFCEGTIMPLSAGTSFTSTTSTFPSTPATINLAIPDNSATGASNSITVSGIPAGAIINSVSVKFKILHNNTGDLVINVKAPNSNVLNLVNREGGVGDNFSTTTISSAATTSIVGQLAPFNNTYKPEATFNVQGATAVVGNTSNVTSFSSLFDTPNGAWTLSAKDIVVGTAGKIESWSIIVDYTVGAPSVGVVWSPVTRLYNDAGATDPYTGDTRPTVYAKPTAGTSVYTATNTNASLCSVSNNVTLTVNPVPVVSIQAVYCLVPGKVQLTATSVPTGATFLWSNGQTGATIDVDVADVYDVVATLGGCASATASFSVAQELVVNGDFTDGNTGFISQYNYKPNIAGNTELVPDGGYDGYAVGQSGQDYHPNFYGQDHTNNQTGDRNFMLVNGHDSTTVIWEQTVSVLPNTDYYFSAWAMNLTSGNPAKLKFEVNGVKTGTTAFLSSVAAPANNDHINLNNWIRFYSDPKWNSGNATTATIRIVNLEKSASGNDFGLDDISFGTLSTFITLTSPAGTASQNICLGDAIAPIEYNIGSGLPPIVSTLPDGLTSVFNGVNLTINGTPTIPGDYTYTITATGCSPFTATGSLKVKSQKIALSAGTSTQITCKSAAITNIAYTISGEATGATITGLPNGVTMSLPVGKVYTISGTPTVAGIFNYTITTSGINCTPVTTTGIITVQEQTITLFSGSTTPKLCINTTLASNIQYQIGGTGTGAGVTGLPTGVTGTYNSGYFIISGTPSVDGMFNYTVTTTGGCTSTSLSGTITVDPAASIVLTTGNATQQPCLNVAITDIKYTIGGGATGANVTGLPTGVSATYNAGVLTIAGTPINNTGVFDYTVTTIGTCAQTSAVGKITVLSQKIDLTSGATTQMLCISKPIATIIFTISGSATGVNAAGLPAGVTGSLSGNTYTISGSPSVSGVFNYTLTTTGTCSPAATASGSITVQSPTISLTTGNNNQTPCIGLPINNIVYTISGGASGASVTGLPTGITGAYSGGVFTISGTTSQSGTFNFTVTTSGTSCGNATATGTLVTGSVIWTGVNSTNWNDANNWSCGVVPISATNVVIPASAPRMPQLTATSVSKDIELQAGTTFDLNGQSFSASGSFTGTGTIKGSSASSLSINATGGTSSLNFDQTNDGVTNALKNLTVNGAGNNVTVNNKTAVYGTLLPAAGMLNLNSELVLRSDAAGTARVGEVTGAIAYTATGKVTVERYYPMSRSWRLVTSPLSNTGNIFNSWQAGGVYTVGRGMFVSGPAPTGGTGNGLDYSNQNNYSMKGWNSTTNAYVNIGNTTATKLSNDLVTPGIAANVGYYTFVRGDRRRSPDNTILGNMNNTTLSSTGRLQTGSQSFNFNGVASAANPSFELIGNPYASAVDFTKLTKTNVYAHRFFIFDPSLGTVGLFVTMEDLGSPGTFTNALGSTQGNYVQSSQAFFVQVDATGPATLNFKESDKSANYNPSLFRPARPLADMQSLRITLLHKNADNSTLLVDGTYVQFDGQFDDKVDIEDALKFTNITENLSLLRYKQYLAVERRPLIKDNDTLYLQLSKTTQRSYQFAIDPANIDATVTAFLEDSYTQVNTPINMLTPSNFDFVITADPKSTATNRFRIVFKQAALGPLPVTFKIIKANEQNGKIAVNWKVENELNIKYYEVEKSADGIAFTKVNTTAANGANRNSSEYNWLDVNPLSGNNFYRVRSIGLDGKFDYSSTVLVKMGTQVGGIRIYPNPVTDVIGAEFKNMSAGIYTARLLNAQGQAVLIKTINHATGTSMETIKPDYKLLSGIYQLEVTAPDKQITMVKVIVK